MVATKSFSELMEMSEEAQQKYIRDFSLGNEVAWFVRFCDGWLKTSPWFAAHHAVMGAKVRLAQRSDFRKNQLAKTGV